MPRTSRSTCCGPSRSPIPPPWRRSEQAAALAGARGAPESAAGFLRRALAEPPLDPAVAAAVTGELGQALAAHLHPDAPAMLRAAVERAASPEQRCELALRGARALGLGGHFPAAMDVARPVLDDPGGLPAEALARLEAEYVANAWTHAAPSAEARERVRRAARPRALARQRRDGGDDGLRARGEVARAAAARLRDALEDDSLLGTVAAWCWSSTTSSTRRSPSAMPSSTSRARAAGGSPSPTAA